MATSSRLQVTDLDFDSIKENLKNYLKQQQTFQDYDFEGSGLNILLDILAYNTHYNAYYLNMVANESFLDSAVIRDSVVSHAKSLNYTPYSRTASKAVINFEVVSDNNNPDALTLPRGTIFSSNLVDNVSYNFTLINDVTATKANSSYLFENLEIFEGDIITYNYVYSEQNNPKSLFVIPDVNVDTKTIQVTVINSSTNTAQEIYALATDILNVGSSDAVYFLQEGKSGKYEIYFGNNIVGKKLDDNSIVSISYLITSGDVANGVDNFILSSDISKSFVQLILNTVNISFGGSERESIDEIKYRSPKTYASQNRLITFSDYESYILNAVPNLDSISVWGGEEETTPVFGKVFISLKPKNNYFISESEKQRIINEIIKPKSVISTDVIIQDPELLYIKLVNKISYDSKKTILTEENLKNLVQSTILNYFNINVSKFNSSFSLSKLQEEIDNLDTSIVGIQSDLKIEKRFVPEFNINKNYIVNFNTSLFKGSTLDRLFSTQFDVFDNGGIRRTVLIEEIPESFTGVSEIIITNPGYNYISPPNITITGDGVGATAEAKIVNGKVESIRITNSGINYTRAVVQISGGQGFGATGTAILNSRFGNLRLVYFNEKAERQIVNDNIGTINYDTGEIKLNNLKILSVSSSDNLMRLTASSENNIINSVKNTIITIDQTDSSAITTTLLKV